MGPKVDYVNVGSVVAIGGAVGVVLHRYAGFSLHAALLSAVGCIAGLIALPIVIGLALFADRNPRKRKRD